MYNYEECMVVETAKEYVRYIQLVIFWDYSFEIGDKAHLLCAINVYNFFNGCH